MNTNETAKSNELRRWLEFRLGTGEYAIPLLKVREVISIPDTTPIPRAPEHFLGLMNLRGQVISVIDLRKKLKLPLTKDRSSEEAVIIVGISGVHVGVVVDAITRVIAFSDSQIDDVPASGSQVNAEFIQGIFQKETSLVILMNIGKILDVQDILEILNWRPRETLSM